MEQIEVLRKAKEEIRKIVEKHSNKLGLLPEFEVFLIWSTYTAGLSRALFSTTLPTKNYYEVVYTAIGGMIIVEYEKIKIHTVKQENK